MSRVIAASVFALLACRKEDVATTEAAPKPDPPAVASTADTVAPLAPLDSSPAVNPVVPSVPAPVVPVVDLAAWFHARGVDPPSILEATYGTCNATRIHVLGGMLDALMCRGAPDETLPGGESTFPLRVVTVSHGKVVTALKTPIAAGPLDREIDPSEPSRDDNYITLDASFDAAGVLSISEKPGKTCNAVLAQYQTPDLASHRRVIQKACASRGKYTLQRDKLVRSP